MAKFAARRGFTLSSETDQIDVTSAYPSPDPSWRYTDANGHEHHYDDRSGYATLRYVVDAQHWCDGTEGWAHHDPHWHVDESHYECNECGETIDPRLLPGGTRLSIPGLTRFTLAGVVGNAEVSMILRAEHASALMPPTDPDDSEARAVEMLTDALNGGDRFGTCLSVAIRS